MKTRSLWSGIAIAIIVGMIFAGGVTIQMQNVKIVDDKNINNMMVQNAGFIGRLFWVIIRICGFIPHLC